MVARNYFRYNFITDACIVDNVHELFIKVFLEYSTVLSHSIDHLQASKQLKKLPRTFYNYILIDSDQLYRLVDTFNTSLLGIRSITLEDIINFKKTIIYIGKGKKERRNIHINEAILILEGKLNKNNAKYTKMLELWKTGRGIVVLQLLSDSDHYLALCRENAMIKATGKTLTNINNGSVYGLMKNKWTYPEILNFGEMLLYFSLRKCIFERPCPTYPYDIK